ncbi:MAG TPA: transcription factor FapR [Bacillota bacterium]
MTEKTLTMLNRHRKMKEKIEENPFITDEELASFFKVSIHTIRADRKKIGIPEVRKRTKDVAVTLFGQAKTLNAAEQIGELLEVDLDQEGLSLLDTTEEMGIGQTKIVRGHVLFAQANSLANTIVDADVALTGAAQIKFTAPVRVGERVLAKARVVKSKGRKKEVEIIMKTKRGLVFQGMFEVYCLDLNMASKLQILKSTDRQGGEE